MLMKSLRTTVLHQIKLPKVKSTKPVLIIYALKNTNFSRKLKKIDNLLKLKNKKKPSEQTRTLMLNQTNVSKTSTISSVV